MRLLSALAVLAVACSGKSKSPAAPAAGSGPVPIANPYPTKPTGPAIAQLSNAPGVKVTLADVGLEQSALDRTVDPCVDFYQFTCGGWLANAEATDKDRWGRLQEVEDRNRTAMKALLEEAAKGLDASTKKLGDFYASCMDEATAERSGLQLAKPLLDKVRIRDAKGWQVALAELHAHGIWVVWRADTAPDPKDAATHALYLDATPALELAKPRVTRLLARAGIAKPEAAAADVTAIEAELARIVRGDSAPLDVKALAKQSRAVDWKAYWKRLGVTPGKKVIAPAKLLPAIDRIKARFKPAQWASYFTFHALATVELGLGKSDDQLDRSTRCIHETQRALADLFGQQYATKYFPATAKQTATQLVDALARAVGDELTRVDWLTDATRAAALAKLAKVARLVGFPEHWKTSEAEVKRDDFVGNVLRTHAADTRRELARWGKPVDRAAWELDAFAGEPSYDAMTSAATLPAGALQPPFFGPDRSVAANLGGLGMVYGRTLVKPFDAELRKLDERTKCVETQYASFEAMPKAFVNGKLTLAENIADMGGVKMAFKAYRALRKDAAKVYVADGYTEDQQFFIAVGQASCSRDKPAELTKRLATDPYAPPKFRIYGALRNLKEFSEAFSCAPGTPMNPAKSCSVW
jgi:putative endopeptidase